MRAEPGRDTDTHCGEMSKRTSLSSHSTSNAPLMAATRPDESARRPGNGVGGRVGGVTAARIGCGAARGERARSRAPPGSSPGSAEVLKSKKCEAVAFLVMQP